MAQSKISELSCLAPAFQHDRDEIWAQYLPPSDSNYLSSQRNRYHVLTDKLDRCKQEQKGFPAGSEERENLKKEALRLRREVDRLVTDLIPRVRSLKEKAKEAQRIQTLNAARPNQGQKRPQEDDGQLEGLLPGSFLPSHMTTSRAPQPVRQEPARSATRQPAAKVTPAARTQQTAAPEPSKPQRDTYLDGVASDDVAIMKRLRPLAEKYQCKDRILEALKHIRRRDGILEALDEVKKMRQSTIRSKAVVASSK